MTPSKFPLTPEIEEIIDLIRGSKQPTLEEVIESVTENKVESFTIPFAEDDSQQYLASGIWLPNTEYSQNLQLSNHTGAQMTISPEGVIYIQPPNGAPVIEFNLFNELVRSVALEKRVSELENAVFLLAEYIKKNKKDTLDRFDQIGQ